jgi:hypothetical protein
MRLQVYWVDMRGGYMSDVAWQTDVIDQDTGKNVGFVDSERSPRARRISLFGGKYQGDFKTREECDAFAKGVEAVLNHLTAAADEEGEEQENSEAAKPVEHFPQVPHGTPHPEKHDAGFVRRF